jgi:shikimate kinase
VVKSTSENAPRNSHEKQARIVLKQRSGKTVSTKKRIRVRSKRADAHPSVRCDAIVLVGFMGAGKSSVGRALGQRLNWIFEDLDDRIERHQGRKVAEIFRDSGERGFRQAEHSALQQALEELQNGGARVIALGGGAFVQEKNAALLLAAGVPTVFLDAPVEELWRRCCEQAAESGAQRPLLQSREQFRKLHGARSKSYAKASLKIRTGDRTVKAVAAEIARALRLRKIDGPSKQGEVE